MKRLLTTALIALPLMAGAEAAFAHHSFAMYDNTVYTKISGTIKSYRWANPHTMIELQVTEPGGATVEWTAECSPTNMLRGKGWTLNSLKAGDKVDVVLHPNRHGEKYGLTVSVAKTGAALLKDKD